MSDAGYYRSEAERWLKWAEACLDPEVARRRRALASDYNELADELERVPRVPCASNRVEMQQEGPVQQQPIKSQGEK
jgi:hypothetical protein